VIVARFVRRVLQRLAGPIRSCAKIESVTCSS
jgi:hypothetical protein